MAVTFVIACAPKYASSSASSNETRGTGRAVSHTRGSAVRIPSTSFHTCVCRGGGGLTRGVGGGGRGYWKARYGEAGAVPAANTCTSSKPDAAPMSDAVRSDPPRPSVVIRPSASLPVRHRDERRGSVSRRGLACWCACKAMRCV